MNREEFAKLCESKIVILDGATGSNLQKSGMPFGVCPEQWVTENPEALEKLQKEYAGEGSDIVYAATFSANPIKLKEYGLEKQTEELNRKLVTITKRAVDGRTLVAGDLTMTGQQLRPLGTLSFEEMTGAYRTQVRALAGAGADLLVIETMMSLAETRAAVIAAKEASNLPVMVTMSFGENGRTLYGTNAVTALLVLQGLGADAVGINCSAGPNKMIPLLREMKPYARVPLIAKPNAGMPHLNGDGTTGYDMDAEVFAGYVPALVDAGARLIGGCCGTDPSYIRLVAAEADKVFLGEEKPLNEGVFLTTERVQTRLDVPDLTCAFVLPQESRELAEDYENGDFDTLYDLLDEAMDEEADVVVLSVSEDMAQPEKFLEQLIHETTQYVTIPLAFQFSSAKLLECALRNYPGVAGVCLPKEVTQTQKNDLLEVGEKYGAQFF